MREPQHAEGPLLAESGQYIWLGRATYRWPAKPSRGIAVKILHRCSLSCGCLMVALLATITTASPRLLAQATYSIDFGSISSISGTESQNPCFHLTGEIGRPALGFSSNAPSTPTYSMYSGFWTVALTASPDEIFFTGFEAC